MQISDNFQVLGPGGKTLQGMAKEFRSHFYICGTNSVRFCHTININQSLIQTRDYRKEQELLSTGDPEYAHYAEPTHVKIETEAGRF